MELPDILATQSLANQLAQQAWSGKTLYLQGDLGAGKTTFVQAFLRALGY